MLTSAGRLIGRVIPERVKWVLRYLPEVDLRTRARENSRRISCLWDAQRQALGEIWLQFRGAVQSGPSRGLDDLPDSVRLSPELVIGAMEESRGEEMHWLLMIRRGEDGAPSAGQIGWGD